MMNHKTGECSHVNNANGVVDKFIQNGGNVDGLLAEKSRTDFINSSSFQGFNNAGGFGFNNNNHFYRLFVLKNLYDPCIVYKIWYTFF